MKLIRNNKVTVILQFQNINYFLCLHMDFQDACNRLIKGYLNVGMCLKG